MQNQSSLSAPSFTVAALYHFVTLENFEALRMPLLAECDSQGLKGTILLAHEGLNGTVAGSKSAIDALINYLRALPGCADLEVKYSGASEMPFFRMKVRLKKEIVTMGVADIDAVNGQGDYVDPSAWNSLIADPDTIVIDTRNDYEVAVGTFERAINPKTETFREFPGWFDEFSKELRDKGTQPKIAMFCTGGIRCEKATAYVKAQGFDDVFHLKGGILKYLENVDEKDSSWGGDCFVFDQRVAVGHGLKESDYIQCHACRMPLDQEARSSKDYVEGVSCPHCSEERDDAQRERYRERQKQVELLAGKGQAHLGSDPRENMKTPRDDG